MQEQTLILLLQRWKFTCYPYDYNKQELDRNWWMKPQTLELQKELYLI